MKDNQKVAVAFTERDPYTTFLHRKASKVVTALYLVTNLLPDEEPIKWSLRHEGVTLLGEILPLIREDFSLERGGRITAAALSVEALLEVGNKGGLISEMNVSVLQSEIKSFIEAVEDRFKERYISETFFSVPQPTKDPRGQRVGGEIEKRSAAGRASRAVSSSRQDKILDLIKQKKDVSIADIALEIQDCSEKTLLRDLKRLIDTGDVKKTGERRWTRYSLVKI